MNNPKFFDKFQLIITITALGTTLISSVLFFVMVLTGTRNFDEEGVLVSITYNEILQTFFIIFFLIQLTAIVWFVARAITYKMRIKEEESL